jgi:hypothetical protein
MVRLPVIDKLAYSILQVVMLLQAKILELWYMLYPPEGLKVEIKALQNLHSSYYLSQVPLDELPEMIQDKVLIAGRTLLGFMFVAIYFAIFV